MLPFYVLYIYVNNRNYRVTHPVRTLRAPCRGFSRAVWHSDVLDIWHC